MGELNEPRWAVLSDRGCEAASLSYGEAERLLDRLRREGGHGLCIITAEAAKRVPLVNQPLKSPKKV